MPQLFKVGDGRLASKSRIVALLAFLAASHSFAIPGEPEIINNIASFFATSDVDKRKAIVANIEADPDYSHEKVRDWLNRAPIFDEPGVRGVKKTFSIAIGKNESRTVTVRIPKDYDPHRAWPMIYALHGTGGNADGILQFVARMLGDRVDDFLLVAPTGYEQVVIHSQGGPSAEHPLILREAKKRFHVDSDRVYCTGYSRGGHTSWTLAILHPDQFAAVMPLAGTFNLMGVDQLWDAFLPNLRHLPIFHVWGAQDTGGHSGLASPEGGIAGVSRMLQKHTAALGLPATHHEYPDRGHGNNTPPAALLDEWLGSTRQQTPSEFEHTFRWPYQASAYWLEGHRWVGKFWDENPLTINPRKDEEPIDALHRAIRGRLARLEGKIDGQAIDVRRKKIRNVMIWFSDDMIDWEQPVAVKVSARMVFDGTLERDLFVCLTQAARTYDLQRLRWAGLMCKSGRKAKVIAGDTELPALFDE